MLCLLVEESKSIWTLRDGVTSYGGGACSLWSRAHKGRCLHRRLSDVGRQGVHEKDIQDAFFDSHSAEMVRKGWANAYCRQHVHDLKEGESQSKEGECLSLWSFDSVSRTSEEWQEAIQALWKPQRLWTVGMNNLLWAQNRKTNNQSYFATVLTNYLTIYHWLFISCGEFKENLQWCIFSWTQKLLSSICWKTVRTQMSACNNFN